MNARILMVLAVSLGVWLSAVAVPAAEDAADPFAKAIEQLRSPDAEQRVAGARQLRHKGKEARAAVPVLIGLLRDETTYKEEEWTDPRYPPQILTIVVAAEAAETLAMMARRDESALQALAVASRDPDEVVRRNAVIGLTTAEHRGAADALIAVLTDKNVEIREQAAKGLFYAPNAKAVRPLGKLLDDPEVRVRLAAVRALDRINSRESFDMVRRALEDEQVDVRVAAVEALWYRDGWAESTALRIRLLGDKEARVRAAAADVLLRVEGALPPLLEAAKNEKLAYRGEAAHVAAQLRDYAKAVGRTAELRQTILDVFRDPRPEVRARAAEALALIDAPQAVEPLIAALGDDHAGLRRAAAASLGALGNRRAVEPLIRLLADADANVRMAAVESLGRLGRLGQQPAVAKIIPLAEDDDPAMRVKAAEALGRLADRRATDVLVKNLTHADARVRLAAAKALQQVKDARALQPLLEFLKRDEPEPGVRQSAIMALGATGDRRATDPLTAILADEKAWHGYRKAAIKALGRLPDARAVATLISAATGSELVSQQLGPHEDYPFDFCRVAADEIVQLGSAAVGPLREEVRKLSKEGEEEDEWNRKLRETRLQMARELLKRIENR